MERNFAKIVPSTSLPPAALRVKDLAEFFHHLPVLENEDKQAFSREIGDMRSRLGLAFYVFSKSEPRAPASGLKILIEY